ncbi:MAG: ABC transporter ATP-binding protein [Methanosarcinales archaeon Met12]|nr:MAG: ABC transporter ATP-binding protein [Methanosarcinales archaeon Met12]
MMIELINVSKSYEGGENEFWALRNINLKIEKGDFTSIVGPSGSGKSTLLHILGFLDKPTKGAVLIDGKHAERLSDDELTMVRRDRVGFVFQQYYLNDSMSALQNVMLPLEFSRDNNRKEKAVRLLGLVGLADKLDNYPSGLSGGEQQRVAIARALANNPELILADEPTGNLDSASGNKILNLLTELNKEKGVAMVIITHDEKIANTARKKIKLFDGMII